ncbi:MAG: DUF1501 domain-containing protein [Planctomycetes bacterium]|nr:DUF1501 domain-containing protein [Planctomycetota bacterium]
MSGPRLSRRRCLEIGACGLVGLDLPLLTALRAAQRDAGSSLALRVGVQTLTRSASEASADGERANACVFIFLFGGPSHLDLFDLKPDAPLEVRGEFRPIATNVPGVQIGEHLPLVAAQMDKLCLVRSMSHGMNVHGPAASEVYSGRPYFGPPVTDQASPEDWPSLASLVARFGRPGDGIPHSVVLPWYSHFVGQDKRIAGQTGGRMGEEFDPFLVEGNPAAADFQVQGLSLPADVPAARFQRRRRLLDQLSENGRGIPQAAAAGPARLDRHYQTALDIIDGARAAQALDLEAEPPNVRERYGRTRFGQSLLLARRLIEAGVSLVTVNWDDDHKDDKVSPHWDTHVDNFPKLKDRLCPVFDRALAAFIEDLHDRGLLATTLVAALGEFGRTPRIGAVTQNGMTERTGRDHWPHAFTAVLAGGGVRGGQVYGSTNRTGGYVQDSPVSPADLAATVLEHLGVDPALEYDDRFLQIRQRVCEGRAIDFG